MRIAYHLTAPPPRVAGADAVHQEVEALRARFGGEVVNLFPLSNPARWFPKALYGRHLGDRLRELDDAVDLHHVYFANLHVFPVLRRLRKPIVYSVAAGLQGQRQPAADALRRIRCVAVSNDRDRAVLKSWGVGNYRLIRPGIDTSRFTHTAPAARWPFVLLAGSAPWVRRQFAQKGVDAMLWTLRQMPDLRVVFLWRGILKDQLMRRVRRLGVEAQVEVLDGAVNVNEVLARCHAAVVLAETPRIVKAYPHSLLESLAAGKPVIASRAIPMSDYIAEKECGAVAASPHPHAFKAAVENLVNDYDRFQSNALRTGARDFAVENLLQAYGELYKAALAG